MKVIAQAEERARPHRRSGHDPKLPTVAIKGPGHHRLRRGAIGPGPSIRRCPRTTSLSAVQDILHLQRQGTGLDSIFSENMDAQAWSGLARAILQEIEAGANGVIIPHGTDTMGFTAAALSFMLEGLDRPVVLVGAQLLRRPSSDAYTNLVAAALLATADASGVFVLMHEGPSDSSAPVHLGTG